MRCEECAREISNAEIWKLAGTRDAPTARSMRNLCWECRERQTEPATERAMAHAGSLAASMAESGHQ